MIAKINNTRKTIEVLGHDLKIGDKFMEKGLAFRIIKITYDTDWKMLNSKSCSAKVNRYIVTGEWIKMGEDEITPSYCCPTTNSIIRALREDLYWTMLDDEGYNQYFQHTDSVPNWQGFSL